MIKVKAAWIGTPELFMGDTEHGDYRDMESGSHEPPELLVSENYRRAPFDENLEEDFSSSPSEYRESAVSTLTDEDTDEINVDDLLEAFIVKGFTCNNILCIGNVNIPSYISKKRNITAAASMIDDDNIYKASGDARYSKFGTKFDGVIISKSHDICKSLIENVYSHLRPKSFIVMGQDNINLIGKLSHLDFSCYKSGGLITLIKNDVSKQAFIKIYSSTSRRTSPKVCFNCDIASTFDEKRAGLQVYPELKKSNGLLFKYSKPQDVMYHMGTVGYPIDIIFISEDDKIRKMEKNIAPGSLATFACSNVFKVLEIKGGLSDLLGLTIGDRVVESFKSLEDEKFFEPVRKFCNELGLENFFVKSSAHASTSVFRYGDNSIFTINKKDPCTFSKLASVAKPSERRSRKKDIYVFYLDDGLLEKDASIRLYEASEPSLEDEDVRCDVYNNAFVPISRSGAPSFYNISLDKYSKKSFHDNFKKSVAIKADSFSGFFENKKFSDANNHVYDSIADTDKDVVFVTKRDVDEGVLKDILYASFLARIPHKNISNFDVLKVSNGFSFNNIINAVRDKYETRNVSLFSCIKKVAGMPVPKETKEKAKRALSFFTRSTSLCDDIFNNLKQNSSEYEKIKQNNPESIGSTKGLYNESVKRNSKIVKRMLVNIRDGIKIMNAIRDISSTTEIIDALALSAKSTSSLVKEIFDLINVIESEEFSESVTAKTGELEKIIGDLKSTISRMIQYINSNVLGIVILSE